MGQQTNGIEGSIITGNNGAGHRSKNYHMEEKVCPSLHRSQGDFG
jgi:hypothetical protein